MSKILAINTIAFLIVIFVRSPFCHIFLIISFMNGINAHKHYVQLL